MLPDQLFYLFHRAPQDTGFQGDLDQPTEKKQRPSGIIQTASPLSPINSCLCWGGTQPLCSILEKARAPRSKEAS